MTKIKNFFWLLFLPIILLALSSCTHTHSKILPSLNAAEIPVSQKNDVNNQVHISNSVAYLSPQNDKIEQNIKQSDVYNATCQLPKNVSKHVKNNKLPFKQWLNAFKHDAVTHYGLSNETVTTALKNAYPIKKVIQLDRRQKEYSVTFSKYLRNSISAKRIADGKKMLKKYRTLLSNIENQYGVQPQILVALWAMESNFGQNMGNFSTISTLATLAHEGRRHHFFQNELICALHILEQQHINVKNMKSSWAGAMGQPQFMPSTFFYYAADGDNDNKKDIWHNKADVFASAANYLKTIGWQRGESWGLEVKLPKNFDFYQARLAEKKSVQMWKKLGVTKANGQPLSENKHLKGSIMLPSGKKGAAFLVFQNFRVIREWNRSTNYALTVGHLSDRLMGQGRLIGKAPKGEKPLTRQQALSLQENLKKLGFYQDKIDGMIGLNSRNAIREYQKSSGMPADAYPSPEIMLQIENEVKSRY